VAGLAHVLDPEVIILGGQISAAGDVLLEPLRKDVGWRTRCLLRRDVPVVRSKLVDPSGGIGAAALALEALRGGGLETRCRVMGGSRILARFVRTHERNSPGACVLTLAVFEMTPGTVSRFRAAGRHCLPARSCSTRCRRSSPRLRRSFSMEPRLRQTEPCS